MTENQLTFLLEEPPASPTPSQEDAVAWMTRVATYHSPMWKFFLDYNQDGFCGKMSPDSCQWTEDGRLEPSSGRWLNAGIVSATESSTLNISEFNHTLVPSPSSDGVSSLLDVLEVTGEHLREYYLSGRACRGIIHRAEKEGRKLPGFLDTVLRKIAGLKRATESQSLESAKRSRRSRRKAAAVRQKTSAKKLHANPFPPQLWDI